MRGMTLDEFYDAMGAVQEGRAMDVRNCYLCEPNVNARMERNAGPLRGVADTRLGGPSHDPTELTIMVPCGHVLL